jgi:acyl-CoA synthetase
MNERVVDPATVAEYVGRGWWGTRTIAQEVSDLATRSPDGSAFITVRPDGDDILTWRDYDQYSTRLAHALVHHGLNAGDRVAVMLPDGAAVHISFLAIEKAGMVVAGIGARAGDAEIGHLLEKTGARAFITNARHRDQPATELLARLKDQSVVARQTTLTHFTVPTWTGDDVAISIDGDVVPADARLDDVTLRDRSLGPNDLFMVNSTSGTTGLPKCVMHTQNRWFYFHQLAVEAGDLASTDIFCGAVPAPFGFGLWTAHFTPTILGAPTLIAERFDAGQMLQAMDRHGVTVLACVSTQFLMMLKSPSLELADLSPLRVMFTGGEAVPFERAVAFEDRTGASVLQFFGSNETGAISRTTLRDSRENRLKTAGKLIEDMSVRILDETHHDVSGDPKVGVPAGRGPATCIGYFDDETANAELFTADGWMLMGDLVEVDSEGYLRVIGRTSDFIIRGGKNVSAPAVEAEIGEHPDVVMVAVVAMPDDIFGERVCAYVTTREGVDIDLGHIVEFLAGRGVTREWFPERLIVVDELPRSSGAKIAKGELRADVRRRIDAERSTIDGVPTFDPLSRPSR